MKKKMIALLLAGVMLFQITACKTKDGEISDSESGSGIESSLDASSDGFWDDESSDGSDSSDPESQDESQGSAPSSSDGTSVTPGTSGTSSAPASSQGTTPTLTPTSQASQGFVFPTINLTNKTIKVMGVGKTEDKVLINKLKSEYGATIQDVVVAWGELSLKLSAAILSGDSPDAVIYRADNPDMPSFVMKDMVQPIDSYINLNAGTYSQLQREYAAMKWGGKHYVLVTFSSKGSVVWYNTKLFQDYGVEDPWTLYKQGKWNWNKFAEICQEFSDDTNNDGEQDRFGFVLGVPPSAMMYTTGQSFGGLDGANKQITNNIKSPAIARWMNFMHDLLFVKKGGLSNMPTSDPIFRNSIAAMTFGVADLAYATAPTLSYLAGRGQLGVAPMPKDPNADKLYYYSRIFGYFIPKGAANPMGAVALNAVNLYLRQDPAHQQFLEESLMESNFTDTIIQRLAEIRTIGTPVFELTPFIGYNSVWLSFQNELPWATQVAQDEAIVQATIDDIYETEVELPTGPKVVDNFEKHGTSTTTAVSRYIAGTGGAPDIKLYLDSNSPYQGNYNGRIDYNITGTHTWAHISRSLNNTWNTNNTLTLWAKGDGKSPQEMTIQLKSANGAPFNKVITLDGTGRVYSIPFSEFEMSDWWPNKSDTLDINQMSEIGFMFADKGEKRSVWLDMIEAVNK